MPKTINNENMPNDLNTKNENKNIGLEIALVNEITSDNLKDILIEGAEITLDNFLEEGIIKEIPFFGTLYKGFKAAIGIRETIFAKKVFSFLNQIKEIPLEERKVFIEKLESKKEFRQKVGEKLIFLIERLDDLEKPEIIGRLFKATIKEKITYDEFLRLSLIVDKAFMPDLLILKRTITNQLAYNQITKEHFATIGIMSIEYKEKPLNRVLLNFESNSDKLLEIKYQLNDLGKKLIKYGLN